MGAVAVIIERSGSEPRCDSKRDTRLLSLPTALMSLFCYSLSRLLDAIDEGIIRIIVHG